MNTVCASCHTTNRLPTAYSDGNAKCGRCGTPLFTGEVINATESAFDKLLTDELPVVVDFWAPWCRPCVNFAPIFADVARERAGKMRFIKVNTEQEPILSARFRIRSIPTIMLFIQGKPIDILGGALPKADFIGWLDESLSESEQEIYAAVQKTAPGR